MRRRRHRPAAAAARRPRADAPPAPALAGGRHLRRPPAARWPRADALTALRPGALPWPVDAPSTADRGQAPLPWTVDAPSTATSVRRWSGKTVHFLSCLKGFSFFPSKKMWRCPTMCSATEYELGR